ncbi:MAG: hypothetical protein QOE61_5474 [Micromonosporaceae bacterium]|jgi:hypothetical protein|nr:hypothetical protein [Micromonosporaceae bacterium]
MALVLELARPRPPRGPARPGLLDQQGQLASVVVVVGGDHDHHDLHADVTRRINVA